MAVLDRFRLDGKVALITGGGRGAGLQIAEALGEAGATVAHVTCDLSNGEEVEAAVKHVVDQFEHIDILVNNPSDAAATLSNDGWEHIIHVNVDGTFFISRAVGLHMIERGRGGRIITIAPPAHGNHGDRPITPSVSYSTSKGAVANFTRALAASLAEHNITVNCICPGKAATTVEDQDLKGLALLFASDASAYITGQVIAVDGGATDR